MSNSFHLKIACQNISIGLSKIKERINYRKVKNQIEEY
jgi:hypothetical protein